MRQIKLKFIFYLHLFKKKRILSLKKSFDTQNTIYPIYQFISYTLGKWNAAHFNVECTIDKTIRYRVTTTRIQ